ncbi:hypothetical protein VSH64_00620 [Amycolatopsis rhabdoformis]|uniref:DUF3592 domain-containing protein n=1 Tax=Amycolatopsis rhabdoformis TaxID=1448059 RepID=A0ABZ1IAQ2_9PSEU|nr:hypothetical protein [Amycolatopsis rhabdoformis]WSE30649.1 hypothetical protein VSH64_00620 [Amycolatopsis rhabdoformis]
MTPRPVGKKRRGAAKFPAVRQRPGDGEPYLPPQRDARPADGHRVLERMAGRVAMYLAVVVVCVGAAIGGVNWISAQEAQLADAHQADLTVYGDVVGRVGDSPYFEVSYPGPDGPHLVTLGDRRGEFHAVGDRVEVTFSPADPAHAWDPATNLRDPLPESLAFAVTFAGMLGWATAAGFAAECWVRRRVVRRSGWRAAQLDFDEPGVVRATFTDGTQLRLRPARGLSRAYARLGRGRHVGFLAGAGDRMVLLVPGKPELSLKAVSTRWT